MEETQMGGQYSVQNTKEVLDLGLTVYLAGKNSLADGKLGVEDIGNIMLVVPKVGPAIQDIGLVPAELGELDAEDQAELLEYGKQKLGDIGTDKLTRIIGKSLKLGLCAAELWSEVRS